MPTQRKIADFIAVFFLISIIVVSFLSFSPLTTPVPNSDSGIFIHMGSEILKGKVIYLQAWDNKQPLLYAVNALGLWLGRGSIWGVWGLELTFFIVLAFLLYKIMRKTLTPLFALAVILTSYLTTFQFMTGNYSEEYAIFVQTLILAVLFLVYLPNRGHSSRLIAALVIGVLTGLAFCFKQTYLDVSVAVVIYILFLAWLEKDKGIYLRILGVLFGFLLVNIPIFLYFQYHHALNDYLINAFLFYRYYASQGLLEFLHSILEFIEYTSAYPFLFLTLGLWLAGFVVICIKIWPLMNGILNKRYTKWVTLFFSALFFAMFAFAQIRGGSSGIGLLQWLTIIFGITFLAVSGALFTIYRAKPSHPITQAMSFRQSLASFDWVHPGTPVFLFLGFLDFPILIISISMSGMNFRHYYISLFPAVLLLIAAATVYIQKICHEKSTQVILNGSLLAIMLSGLFVPTLQIIAKLQTQPKTDPRAEAAAYINSKTAPNDAILQWGWESVIYFLADREASTRYSMQFPAYFETPWRDQVLTTLLNDLKTNPPVYIADTQDPVMPFIEGKTMSQCLYANPADGAPIHQILNFVCSHYEFETNFSDINIYHYIE